MHFNVNMTLEQLENNIWGEPVYESYLVKECHRLRKIPINKLGVEDFRVLIGQGISLKYLVPVALDMLVKNPFVSGDYYYGDLLLHVVRIPADFWNEFPDLMSELTLIMVCL